MSSRGRDLLKLSSIVVVAFGLGIAFASALDLPRPGRAAEPDPCRRHLRAQLIDVRRGHLDVDPGHAGAGRVQQPRGEFLGGAGRHDLPGWPVPEFKQP